MKKWLIPLLVVAGLFGSQAASAHDWDRHGEGWREHGYYRHHRHFHHYYDHYHHYRHDRY